MRSPNGGIFQAEVVEYNVRTPMHSVHAKLAYSAASDAGSHFTESTPRIQSCRFVVSYPMEVFVGDEEKEGFEFVWDLAYFIGVEELRGRDQPPFDLEDNRQQLVQGTKRKVGTSPWPWTAALLPCTQSELTNRPLPPRRS